MAGPNQEDNMKYIYLIIAITISTITADAQNEIDALRYSTNYLSGTARYSAMGGAFGSLGGESATLSSNPAGLGMYQFSEFTFSPSLNLNTTRSYYNNSQLSSYKSSMSISNLGLVFAMHNTDSEWRRVNIGIGWNQLGNYNNEIEITGINNDNSIVDNILEVTNGILIGDLTEGSPYSQMAWETYLINPFISDTGGLINGQYVSNFSSEAKSQRKVVKNTGGMNELVFSIGSSYQENIYIGATIGIPTINYYEYSEYTEDEISDTSNNLRGMLFSEEISSYATGYNLKIGAIYRLSEKIKIGGAIHTPTFFSLEENYNTSITTFFKDSTLEYSMGYMSPFNYNLVTPLKAIVSASTLFNNIIISAEYELIDYTKTKFFTANFEEENAIIKNIYKKTENIKIGSELIIKPFVLRAGYAKYGSAFKIKDFSRENFSYGLGINTGNYFFDFAYILSQSANEHLLYSEEYIAPIDLVTTNHSLLFTVGFRY